MNNLTTPKAILYGFLLVAVSIMTLPYSPKLISLAHAAYNQNDTSELTTALEKISRSIGNIRACRN